MWYYELKKINNFVIFNGFIKNKEPLTVGTVVATFSEEFKPKLRQFARCTKWNDANIGVNLLISDQEQTNIKTEGLWNISEVWYFNVCWSSI